MPMAFSEAVQHAIEQALGGERLIFTPFASGFSKRTCLVQDGCGRRWVARVQPAPAEELRRGCVAQQLALAAGVRAPAILGQNLDRLEQEEYGWSVEEYVPGKGFDHQGFDRVETRQ